MLSKGNKNVVFKTHSYPGNLVDRVGAKCFFLKMNNIDQMYNFPVPLSI